MTDKTPEIPADHSRNCGYWTIGNTESDCTCALKERQVIAALTAERDSALQECHKLRLEIQAHNADQQAWAEDRQRLLAENSALRLGSIPNDWIKLAREAFTRQMAIPGTTLEMAIFAAVEAVPWPKKSAEVEAMRDKYAPIPEEEWQKFIGMPRNIPDGGGGYELAYVGDCEDVNEFLRFRASRLAPEPVKESQS